MLILGQNPVSYQQAEPEPKKGAALAQPMIRRHRPCPHSPDSSKAGPQPKGGGGRDKDLIARTANLKLEVWTTSHPQNVTNRDLNLHVLRVSCGLYEAAAGSGSWVFYVSKKRLFFAPLHLRNSVR